MWRKMMVPQGKQIETSKQIVSVNEPFDAKSRKIKKDVRVGSSRIPIASKYETRLEGHPSPQDGETVGVSKTERKEALESCRSKYNDR